jgi:hypothetical protein
VVPGYAISGANLVVPSESKSPATKSILEAGAEDTKLSAGVSLFKSAFDVL